MSDGFSSEFFEVAHLNNIAVSDARAMYDIPPNSVDLIVTSPPALGSRHSASDNWLETWFLGLNGRSKAAEPASYLSADRWRSFISGSLREMLRVLKPRSYAVIDVAEGLSEADIEPFHIVAEEAEKLALSHKRLLVDEVLVNQQKFSKVSDRFALDGRRRSTDSNKLVVLRCVPLRSQVAKSKRSLRGGRTL